MEARLAGRTEPGEVMVELCSYQAVVVAAVRRSEEGRTPGCPEATLAQFLSRD
jgi:hypothetical protein